MAIVQGPRSHTPTQYSFFNGNETDYFRARRFGRKVIESARLPKLQLKISFQIAGNRVSEVLDKD